MATDESGFAAANPLFMKYTPSPDGHFVGQNGYGYRSIEAFVAAAVAIREGSATPRDYAGKLATVEETSWVTAVLEAGRQSLDTGGRVVEFHYDADRLVGMK